MGKIQRSYCLPAKTVETIHDRALADGTSDAEALASMVAEWDTLRDAVGIHDNAGSTGELRAVREALADARATVEDLRARLDDATKQNATMARMAEHAQVLHAMETRDKSKRPSLMNRLRALLGGGYENQLNRTF